MRTRPHGLARPTIVFAVFCTSMMTGCDHGGGERSLVSDSAGVTIVENFEPVWSTDDAWHLSEAPLVDIGVVEGDPNYQLHRVTSSARFADGTIVLANSGTQEVRWYDRDGRYICSAGGEGGGPGEFQALYRIAISGDSTFAFDTRSSRITVFDRSGAMVRSVSFGNPPGVMLGVFADGSILLTDSDLRTHLQRRMAEGFDKFEEGSVRVSDVATRYTADGEFVDSLGSFPGTEGTISLRSTEDFVSVGFGIQSFGRRAVFALADSEFYVGIQDSYEVSIYDTSGTLTTNVRSDQANAPVTAADITAHADWVLDQLDDVDEPRNREDVIDEETLPETMPAFGSINVDDEGNLWVEEYRYDGSREEPRWTVFGQDRQLLGTVLMPRDFQVHHIGSDFVLGVWRDDMDVEHVQLYSMVKP